MGSGLVSSRAGEQAGGTTRGNRQRNGECEGDHGARLVWTTEKQRRRKRRTDEDGTERERETGARLHLPAYAEKDEGEARCESHVWDSMRRTTKLHRLDQSEPHQEISSRMSVPRASLV